METSADGQVGGLDATDAVKRSMAAESPAFRCATCRKTNAEIIAECEAAAAACATTAAPVEVPEELKLAFKDEIGAAAATAAAAAAGSQTTKQEELDEEARLAEGFVQTGPAQSAPAAENAPAQNDDAATAAAQLHARLHAQNAAFAQQIHQQMQEQMQQHHQQILQQHQNHMLAGQATHGQGQWAAQGQQADYGGNNVAFLNRNVVYAEDVPVWIDMAIAGLLCLLTTLMFKWGYLDRLLMML